jgi:hypothetical protein
MSKRKLVEPEPELPSFEKPRSLKHMSMLGAGLLDGLVSRCSDRGIDIDTFNPDSAPTVQDRDLEKLIGDQAESIRASLDADDYISVDNAAGLARIHPTAVEGLSRLRGVQLCYATGETLVHRLAWDNLVNLLAHERSEHEGRDLEGGKFSWGLMNRREIVAIREALPGFGWVDPWRPKPPPELSPFKKAVEAVKGKPEPRPGRDVTDFVDRDCEFRALAEAIGVRWKWNSNFINRADFSLYDLARLTSYDFEESNPGNARIVGTLFRGCIESAYLAVFPSAGMDREALRAELLAKSRSSSELVSV